MEHSGAPNTWDERLAETYAYDPAGNLTGIGETAGGATVSRQCFASDDLRRLTEAWTKTTSDCSGAPVAAGPDPYWQTWTFDRTGNRLSQTNHPAGGNVTTNYTVPAAGSARPHAVTGTSTTGPGGTTTNSYGYDSAGNMTSRNVSGKPNQTLTWNPEGHLATITEGATSYSYLYDANGGRLISRDPAATTILLGLDGVAPRRRHRRRYG